MYELLFRPRISPTNGNPASSRRATIAVLTVESSLRVRPRLKPSGTTMRKSASSDMRSMSWWAWLSEVPPQNTNWQPSSCPASLMAKIASRTRMSFSSMAADKFTICAAVRAWISEWSRSFRPLIDQPPLPKPDLSSNAGVSDIEGEPCRYLG